MMGTALFLLPLCATRPTPQNGAWHVDLINAREGGQIVDEVVAKGFDLDDGMNLRDRWALLLR